MKKTLLSLVLLTGVTLNSNAQIVITGSDIATPGKQILLANDTAPSSSITLGGTGSAQTWDYSALANNFYDTVDVMSPSAGLYGSNFAGANLCISSTAGGTRSWGYIKNGSTMLEAVGNVLRSPFNPSKYLKVTVNPSQLILPLPCALNTTLSKPYSFVTGFKGSDIGGQAASFDSIRTTVHGIRQVTADAEGVLITPNGTFDVIRVETFSVDTTDIEGKTSFTPFFAVQQQIDTTYQYDFWTKTGGYPFLTVSYNAASSTITNVQWNVETPNAVAEQVAKIKGISVYPSINNGTFYVNNGNATTLEVYNQNGAVVYSSSVSNGLSTITLGDVASGVYFVKAFNSKNQQIETQQMIINK